MADPGEGPRGPAILPSPLFLHQTKARKAKKKNFGDHHPPLFSKGQDDRPPFLPYLKVWIRQKYTTVHNTKRKKEKKKGE